MSARKEPVSYTHLDVYKRQEKTGCTEKYMLWDSTQGMKPVSTAKLETTEVTNDKDLVLEYVGEAVATKAELGGGEDYIYLCLLYTSR